MTSPGALELIEAVLDPGSWLRWDEPLPPEQGLDPAYADALAAARERTGLDESVVTGEGRIRGRRVAVVACEFGFLAGSIGVAGRRPAGRRRRAGHRRAAAAARVADLRRHPDAGGHARRSCRW